ncbi:MAG TPA: ABC transporter ATP-binding protein, partial [Actinopolymorphaceae bacterium]
IVEMIKAHEPTGTKVARRRAIELLGLVGIPRPEQRVDDYPHQFSGGMRQRVMIAMALALDPQLIIADEPTTALDATVQAQIIELLLRLQDELDTALILITHDLGVIAEVADTVLVMYAGKIVEVASRRTAYYRPHHPYTVGLLRSVPGSVAVRERLTPITGQPPSMIAVPPGCAFHPRCPYVMEICPARVPDLFEVGARDPLGEGATDHRSACWLPAEAVGLDETVEQVRVEAQQAAGTP